MNVEPHRTIPTFCKRLWGKLVFRYAGRNPFSKNETRTRKFYNAIGKMYDRLYAEQINGYQQAAEHLILQYIQEKDHVLDVGCGTGLLTSLCAQKAEFTVGIDLSVGMIRHAQEKTPQKSNTHFIVGDCRTIPVNYSFDKIITSFMMVILNREDQENTIREFKRLLRCGGQVIFLTAHESVAPQWLSEKEWRRLCQETGFEKVCFEELMDDYRVVSACKPMSTTNQEKKVAVALLVGET